VLPFRRAEAAGGPCKRPSVVKVYGFPFCEEHGTETKASALDELHADAMFALENMEGTYRTDMNPEALKAIVASRRELGARWPDIGADIEATRAAYPFGEDLMDEDFREWDHDAEPIHPADWCREQRTVIHKLMRITYSGGAQYALENLEYHREHVAAQLAYAMVDSERRRAERQAAKS
jgi:hypothetical protein